VNRWERLIRGIGLVIAIVFLVIIATPLTNILSETIAVPEAIQPSDAIVVLGAGMIHTGALREESMRRIVHGMELYQQGLAPLLIVLGNSSEIELRSRLARNMGIPASAIRTIETNTTTREEASRTAELLREHNGHRILLVTESLHMRRAKVLFEHEGFEVWPAVSRSYSSGIFFPGDRLWLAMRVGQEFTALLYYRLAGYI
jgi:uncharacterized SAM-binding protein YcdF (DUF218 family)